MKKLIVCFCYILLFSCKTQNSSKISNVDTGCTELSSSIKDFKTLKEYGLFSRGELESMQDFTKQACVESNQGIQSKFVYRMIIGSQLFNRISKMILTQGLEEPTGEVNGIPRRYYTNAVFDSCKSAYVRLSKTSSAETKWPNVRFYEKYYFSFKDIARINWKEARDGFDDQSVIFRMKQGKKIRFKNGELEDIQVSLVERFVSNWVVSKVAGPFAFDMYTSSEEESDLDSMEIKFENDSVREYFLELTSIAHRACSKIENI